MKLTKSSDLHMVQLKATGGDRVYDVDLYEFDEFADDEDENY